MDVATPRSARQGGGFDLDEIARLLDGPQGQKAKAIALKRVGGRLWYPSPGPQTEAYFSDADELFYGGQAGGGKTDLGIGLATTSHHRSLIMRRDGPDLNALEDRMLTMTSRTGWNGQKRVLRLKHPGQINRFIELGSCQHESDKLARQGHNHDLKFFDEICQFLESQYTYIIGWNRPGTGAPEGQRCRIVCAGNPPSTPEGEWVRRRWAAWLDPQHPNPAKSGELRWFTNINGVDTEVDKSWRGLDDNGNVIGPKSRTFISASLSDNPYLGPDYRAQLAAMPEPYRSQLMNGDFQAGVRDDEYQIIPSEWIRAAIERGKVRRRLIEQGVIPRRVMTAAGLDCALGGKDNAVFAPVYDNLHVGELIRKPGKEIKDGTYLAAMVVQHHRDYARLIIDMGGGYGDSCYTHLKGKMVPDPAKYTGSGASTYKALGSGWGMFNKRTEFLWRVREMLDPANPAAIDNEITLPDDQRLMADWTAPTYRVKSGVVHAETKEKLTERIGRSTDDGDATMMALCAPPVSATEVDAQRARYNRGGQPGGKMVVRRGYAAMKERNK